MSFLVKSAHAQIVNKAIPFLSSGAGASNPSQAFARYIAVIWKTIVIFGGIAVLLYFIWGALDWIFSGSNAERMKHAKDKMFNGILGLIFLVLSYAIVQIISRITGLNILNPLWPTL